VSASGRVAALQGGYTDTDMSDHIDPGQKSDPAVIAAAGLDGIAAGATELIADEIATAFGRPARRRPRNRFRTRAIDRPGLPGNALR
jgi:hypothetical protein